MESEIHYFVEDNLEAVKSGNLSQEQLRKLCDEALKSYYDYKHNEDYVRHFYTAIIFYVYFPEVQRYDTYNMIKSYLSSIEDQIEEADDKNEFYKWLEETSEYMYKDLARSKFGWYNIYNIKNIPVEIPEELKIRNLLDHKKLNKIIKKYAVHEEMIKETKDWRFD